MTDLHLPNWVEWIAAIGPTAVATSVAYVAWKQWNTADKKLKFDLFERRLKVCMAIKRLISGSVLHGEISPDDYQTFIAELDGAEFLFGDDLRKQIEAIRDMAWRAQLARSRYKNMPHHPYRDQLITEEEEVLQYLIGHRVQIERLFQQEMKLV